MPKSRSAASSSSSRLYTLLYVVGVAAAVLTYALGFYVIVNFMPYFSTSPTQTEIDSAKTLIFAAPALCAVVVFATAAWLVSWKIKIKSVQPFSLIASILGALIALAGTIYFSLISADGLWIAINPYVNLTVFVFVLGLALPLAYWKADKAADLIKRKS